MGTGAVMVERQRADIDAPDRYYQSAHVRVLDRHVVVYGYEGAVFAEYDLDETPAVRSGKVIGTVGGEPFVIDKGCGCANRPFVVTPKGPE
jgi:hypothetical protein